MLWVLSLHIMTLSVWSASVLYVAVLLLVRARQQAKSFQPAADASIDSQLGEGTDAGFSDSPAGVDSMARFVFTHVATPTAVISISAGSVVFLLNQSHHFWLLAKLTLVTFLCITQAMMGLVIIRAERGQFKWMTLYCRSFLVVLSILMIGIVWIVLGKPDTPAWAAQWL